MSDTATPTVSAPATPAPAVAAPAPVVLNLEKTMQKVAQQTTVAPTPPPVQQAVAIVRDPAPKPDAPASPDLPPGSVPPVAEAAPDAAADTPAVEAAPEAPAAPELVGEINSEDDGLRLSAERNADGTFKTKLDPTQKFDFAIKDKETGETKSYSKTIPELMRMAKDGIEGQRVRSEVSYYRENVPKWTQEFETLRTQLADQQALNRELLTSPDELVIQRREEYRAEMSPERVKEREASELRTRLEQLERQTSVQQLTARRNAFMQTRGIAAAIQGAEQVLGVEVIAGKLALATTPLLVNGVIPEKHWPALEQYINGPFQQWVAAERTKKETQSRAASLAQQATERAQREAQAAINDTTRTAVPVGRAAPDAPPEPPKPKNAQEAIHRMVTRPLPSTVATG